MRTPTRFALSALVLAACSNTPKDAPSTDANADGGVADAKVGTDLRTPDASADDQSVSSPSPLVLMRRMSGLWVGPANQTPLGSFPIMPMDFRAADPNVLFARVDLDADNALRMAFFIEQFGDTPDLVFRNGGLFMGLGRDTKTVLESYDEPTATWRFCEPTAGCEYLDAVISFAAEDQMTMDVKVRGEQHMLWTATREEARDLPDPFPAELDPIGNGDAPFPTMPTLTAELSWTDPAPAGAWAWVLLSDTPCGIAGDGCQSSRSIGIALDEGATSATLVFDQIHGAQYRFNAVLDRDGNFRTTPFPRAPDAISFPIDQAVTVDGDTRSSHMISFDL